MPIKKGRKTMHKEKMTRAELQELVHPDPFQGDFLEWDQMAVELEVAQLLYALVRASKPHIVVEAGAGRGISGRFIAEALDDNGKGRLVSYEPDPEFARKATEMLVGLPAEVRLARSSEYEDQRPDLVFIDSLGAYRDEDIHFWIAYDPRPLLVVHDANRRGYDLPPGARLEMGRGLWMSGTASRSTA
jgi:predicted O-methyltransferase YrrM